MKIRILLTFFLIAHLFDVDAQINSNNMIIGNVYNIQSLAPISYHWVYCTDSLTYSDSVQTGTTGQFYFYIGNVLNPNLNFYISTYDCNNQSSYYVVKSPDSVNTSLYFSICDYVNTGCMATFIPDSTGFMTYTFNNTSLGNPTTTNWEFGDGTTSTAYSPTHTYIYPDTFLVHLVITNPSGCVKHEYHWVNVHPGGSCNVLFSYDTITHDSLRFTNSSSTSYIYKKISYIWDFGDGTTDTNENTTHLFAPFPPNNGYNVCLKMTTYDTIFNTIICQDSFCTFVSIISPMNCQNSFTYTNTNQDFSFTGEINPFNPTNYNWDFGDGSTASGDIVSHTFSKPPSGVASYNVCLNTSSIFPNSAMCLSTTCKTIYINGSAPVIYGFVRASGENADKGYVVLYGLNNPSGAFITLDTTDIINGFYVFPAYPVNYPAYLIKAFLNPISNFYNSFLPTYYDSIIYWVNSPPIMPTTNGFNYEINLSPYNSSSLTGNGLISGIVSSSTNMSGVEVLLFDVNDNPINLKFTKNNGTYLFDNLNYGTYKIYVEIPGKFSQPVTVVIDQLTPHVVNLNFVVKDKFVTGINDVEANSKIIVSDIYPNPASEEAFIDFNITKPSSIKIDIINNQGQNNYSETIKLSGGYHHHSIKTRQLAVGFYTIQITSIDGMKIVKKFVISK